MSDSMRKSKYTGGGGVQLCHSAFAYFCVSYSILLSHIYCEQ